jgi:hypothetical protein
MGSGARLAAVVSLIGWVLIAVATALCWGLSYMGGRRRIAVARPADVLGNLAALPVVRVALTLAWAWAGWHLFAR